MDRELQERQAIVDLVTRFGFAIDAKDWEAVGALFAEDAVMAIPVGDPFAGRTAIVAILRAALDHCGPTHHLFSNHLAEIDGDRATARCYVRIYHAGGGDMADKFEETLGTFQLELRRHDGTWRFTRFEERVQIMLGTMEIFRLNNAG
jgi:uncharacterized protein (TIGR02246 family)